MFQIMNYHFLMHLYHFENLGYMLCYMLHLFLLFHLTNFLLLLHLNNNNLFLFHSLFGILGDVILLHFRLYLMHSHLCIHHLHI